MIGIEFRFPAGRWHATAWGTHVNEGVPEWPPSPWRLCRALWATWFHKHQASIPQNDIRELIEVLIDGPLPRYSLPPAVAAHTRHYMPVVEGKKESRTKIFDTFVQVAKAANKNRLLVIWDVDLTMEQRGFLQSLLASMSYFGRAESLVEASLISTEDGPIEINSAPTYSEEAAEGEETVKLLAPLPQNEFSTWRKEVLNASGSKKKIRLPERVSECLLLDTEDWKKAQWNQPPGSRWVVYRRPEQSFKIAPLPRPRPSRKEKLTIARFAVSGEVLPDITQALSIGERLHRSLVKWSDSSPVFSGCDAEGRPLTGHRHAFYFSEPSGHRGEVRFITIFAPDGFGLRERIALERLQSVWDYDRRRLKLTLISMSNSIMSHDGSTPAIFGSSRNWRSITPFIPTRHGKTRKNGTPKIDESGFQIGSAPHDFLRLLKLQFPDWPPPKIEIIPGPDLPRRLVWLDYQRYRRHGQGTRANTLGSGFRLTFPKPVTGPIALGYGAHFGLGLFVPIQDTQQ